MSRAGNEEVNGQAYRDVAEMRERIGHFLEAVYNRTRLHSAPGYCSPSEYEDQQRPVTNSLSSFIMTTTCP